MFGNVGIAGVDGREIVGIQDSCERVIVEIKGHRVLDGFGREFADGKRLIDRAVETQFSETNRVFTSSSVFIDPLTHGIHGIHDNVHDNVSDSRVAIFDTQSPITAIMETSQQSQQSQALIVVLHEQDNADEKLCVGKSRSTRRRRNDDDDD